MDELESYLKNDEKAAIFIPIDVSNMENSAEFADGNVINMDGVCFGSIDIYEDTVVGLIVSIIHNKYKFVITEFNACTGGYNITRDSSEFGKEVIKLLNRFA